MDAATRRNLDHPDAARRNRRLCCRCLTPAPPTWVAACWRTGCTIRCATAACCVRGWKQYNDCSTLKAQAIYLVWYMMRSNLAWMWNASRPNRVEIRPPAGPLRLPTRSSNCATARVACCQRRSPHRQSGRRTADRCSAGRIAEKHVKEEPSSVLREGGVIADGYDADLDELRGIQNNCGDFCWRLNRVNANAPASPRSRWNTTACMASISR